MVAALQLLGLVLERPWGGLALLAPALVWLLAARRGRPVEGWTGTLGLWRQVAQARPAPERRAARLPPPVRWLVAALVAAALALTGPHGARTQARGAWTVVVDRSPSMYLPWIPAVGDPPRALTRLEVAVERSREALAQAGASGDRIVWVAYQGGQPLRVEGDAFPRAWLAEPEVAQPGPPWSSHDAAGTLWLSDAEPWPAPRAAGVALSGGGAVPGPVAARGATRFVWDGQRLIERPAAGPPPEVLLEAGLGGALERVARAWAEARGCLVVSERGPRVVLELVRAVPPAADGATSMVQVSRRDGWAWEVGTTGAAQGPPGEVWLATALGDPAVAWEPGRVTLLLADCSREPQGDPADFALSWAELLDRAVLAPAGVVPVDERRGVGSGRVRGPAAPARAHAGPSELPASLLSALAAALALVALGRRRG